MYSREYLHQLEQNINQKAHSLAMQYMATEDQESDFNKIFLVYKFNSTPAEIITEGMLQLGSWEEVHQYYKRLAKLTHPDKNAHPLANDVFQKIAQAYQEVELTVKQRDAMKAAAKQPTQAYTQPQSMNSFAY